MPKEVMGFLKEGLAVVQKRLEKLTPEIQSVYLSALINSVGMQRNRLPTELNERTLLHELNEALGQKLPPTLIMETENRLAMTRSKRMRENTKYIAQKAVKEEGFWHFFERG